ncbi:phosphoribosylanthranilate isomerase [Novosphingobium sp. M1R2S20]|uniref:N-(5'-phosphoribosyl)anthranilate isomerase n=1 Tax=Novosphingobium rhizovicinum TaxID=3228928 RepID=A0ABV3RDU9_9SPHN
MTTPAIKICGINTPTALDATIAARADYAGLVFFPRSPRNVSLNDAAILGSQAKGRIGTVGLFVDADDSLIAEAVAAASLTVLQLHGTEPPDRAAHLRSRFGLPVWKAVSVAGTQDLARAASYRGAADLVLFDAKTPPGTLPGGMGLSFDWSLLNNWSGGVNWGLAGGLSARNVVNALQTTRASLVDTSSGVETAPGVKDPDMIAAFCAAVRGA